MVAERRKTMIEKYIRVYDDVLPDSICKNAIRMFDQRTDLEDWSGS